MTIIAADITVRYSSIDRYAKKAHFYTLAGARKFAWKLIGSHPDLGSDYAVSDDGIGKITVSGTLKDGSPITLRDLFPEQPSLPGEPPIRPEPAVGATQPLKDYDKPMFDRNGNTMNEVAEYERRREEESDELDTEPEPTVHLAEMSLITERPGPGLTERSLALFLAYAADAGNWSGTPLVGGNVGGSQEDCGNLTHLKKAGLIKTMQSDGLAWIEFTELGKARARWHGVEIQ